MLVMLLLYRSISRRGWLFHQIKYWGSASAYLGTHRCHYYTSSRHQKFQSKINNWKVKGAASNPRTKNITSACSETLLSWKGWLYCHLQLSQVDSHVRLLWGGLGSPFIAQLSISHGKSWTVSVHVLFSVFFIATLMWKVSRLMIWYINRDVAMNN